MNGSVMKLLQKGEYLPKYGLMSRRAALVAGSGGVRAEWLLRSLRSESLGYLSGGRGVRGLCVDCPW